MNCPHCQASTAIDARFCQTCGASLEISHDVATAKPPRNFVRTADREGQGGIRGQQRQKGQIRFHYGHACHARETVQVVERFLYSLKLQTQILDSGDEIIVQGKRKPNLLKKALGLDQAVTAAISVDGNDMKTVVGGVKWIDKAAGAAIGWFIFAPAILTAGWGVYRQRQLFSRLEKEIDNFLVSK